MDDYYTGDLKMSVWKSSQIRDERPTEETSGKGVDNHHLGSHPRFLGDVERDASKPCDIWRDPFAPMNWEARTCWTMLTTGIAVDQ